MEIKLYQVDDEQYRHGIRCPHRELSSDLARSFLELASEKLSFRPELFHQVVTTSRPSSLISFPLPPIPLQSYTPYLRIPSPIHTPNAPLSPPPFPRPSSPPRYLHPLHLYPPSPLPLPFVVARSPWSPVPVLLSWKPTRATRPGKDFSPRQVEVPLWPHLRIQRFRWWIQTHYNRPHRRSPHLRKSL